MTTAHTASTALTIKRPNFAFRIVCESCGALLGEGFAPFCLKCDGMAEVRYDLAKARLYDSQNPYLRFQDLLPVLDLSHYPSDAIKTPLVHAERLGAEIGMPWLLLKDESKLPTGTTKDRMAHVALPFLFERGVRVFCTSSTGNSSTAYANAITALEGMRMYLFTASKFGSRVQYAAKDSIIQFMLRDATFVEAFEAVREFAHRRGVVSERGFFNPGRREGLKLAFMEAVDQAPRPIDWYVQAVSSAMGVHGTYKGAKELRAMGRIDRLPRLLCVQQATCAPMVHAWNEGSDVIRPHHVVQNPTGIAMAILRGNPSRAYPYVCRVVRENGGGFASVSETEIREARTMMNELEGLDPCFSSSAALAGLIKMVREGGVSRADTVLVNLTGSDRLSDGAVAKSHWLVRDGTEWKLENPNDPEARCAWLGA